MSRRRDHRAYQAEREVAQGVRVGRRELWRVADECDVLPELPEDRRHRPEADRNRRAREPAKRQPNQQLAEGGDEQAPVDEVVTRARGRATPCLRTAADPVREPRREAGRLGRP